MCIPTVANLTAFQHTAARRRLNKILDDGLFRCLKFQHTAARRRLERVMMWLAKQYGFNTQPPEGGWLGVDKEKLKKALVSTHSRPKAAGPMSL